MSVRGLRAFAASIVALALTACASGGGSSGLLPNTHLADSTTPKAKKLKAVIRITVPRHRRLKRHRYGTKYISPATQSMAIAIAPSGGGSATNYNVDLTPSTNPNCTSSLISPLICTIAIGLAPGSYTATFATYDGLLSGGNAPDNPPTGNELSANAGVPVNVVVGKPNQIDVTLEGIPVGVTLVPVGNETMSGSAVSGFTIERCGTSRVSVLGLDADDNYILGPGAPTPALVSSDPAHLAVATPAPLSPNAFTLTRPSPPKPGSAVQLTASVTPGADSGGSQQSIQIPVTFNSDLCGIITEYSTPTSGSSPAGITAGPDGAMWFAEQSSGNIARITSAGVITEYSTQNGASPSGITTGPDRALWFADCASNVVGRMTTGGSLTEYSVPTAFSGVYGIALGPDGALWFTEANVNQIGRITTNGTITEYTGPAAGGVPIDIAEGPDDALWFTDYYSNRIGRITTDGVITEYTAPSTDSGSVAITAGPDGALWFLSSAGNVYRMTTGGVATEYPVPNADGISTLSTITSGSDGRLWFTEANTVDAITTNGVVSQYSTPTSGSAPAGAAAGPNGSAALWFTENNSSKVGLLQ